MRAAGPDPAPTLSIDALLPEDMARRCEAVGAAKAARPRLALFALAVLAGAFIGFGALFATTVLAGTEAALPWGVTRLLAGFVFALGLILVIAGGAELFTGDVLMVMACASGRLTLGKMLRAWVIIYAGNLVGAVGTAILVFLSGQYLLGAGLPGEAALAVARGKAGLPIFQALVSAVLCNVLVCLAVWAALGGRTLSDRILVVLWPIAAFVAAGFEHSVANMYYFPLAMLIDAFAPPVFWASIGDPAGITAALTLRDVIGNMVAVTIGNVIGGGVLVALVYWFIYLRRQPAP
jgi:formate/nitrite transporter